MLVLALFGMLVFAVSDSVVLPYLVKRLTDTFADHDPARSSAGCPSGPSSACSWYRASANFTASYGMAWVGQGVVARMRQEVFRHLLRVPVSYHDRTRTADLQAKLTYHASQIADSASSVLASMIQGGLTAIGLLGFMFHTSWRLTLFALLIAPPVSALSISWVNRRFRTRVDAHPELDDGRHEPRRRRGAITGRRVVKLYGGENFVLEQFPPHQPLPAPAKSLKMTAASATTAPVRWN